MPFLNQIYPLNSYVFLNTGSFCFRNATSERNNTINPHFMESIQIEETTETLVSQENITFLEGLILLAKQGEFVAFFISDGVA